jgi:hypothetical protein
LHDQQREIQQELAEPQRLVPIPEEQEHSFDEDDTINEAPEVEEAPRTTRSGRPVKRPKRLIEECLISARAHHATVLFSKPWKNDHFSRRDLNEFFLQTLNWDLAITALKEGNTAAFFHKQLLQVDVENMLYEFFEPFALSVKTNTDDNPTWDEAMNGPDKDGYWTAMEKEYTTLETVMGCWEIVIRKAWMNVLPSTWACRCKRYPDGSVRKLKARFCARGDKQIEGVDYFETFAPVVNWQTIRLMLILSLVLGLATKQVDYTAAFIHAPIDKDPTWDSMSDEQRERSGVYIEVPRGFRQMVRC